MAGRRQTARDIVADHVRRSILNGDLEPGSRLHVAAIAAELDVSQTPTREALQLLASDGLVELSDYRGAKVASLSADEYEEVFLMRLPLEGLASRLGAEKASEEDVELLRTRFAALESAAAEDDVTRFIEADRAFHEVHFRSSGRERLWERIIGLRFAAERYTRLGYSLPGVSMTETARDHRRVLDAVSTGDGRRAEIETRADLTDTFDRVHARLLQIEAEPDATVEEFVAGQQG